MTSPDRHKFVTLDAMRGVAAICVMLFHFRHALPGISGHRVFESGNLAVDLFFALSGFVIAFAYDGRLSGGMTFRYFALIRAIRMLPMIWMGALLGAAWMAAAGQVPSTWVAMAVLANALALPGPHGLRFEINRPEWSLFYELLANFLFGAGHRVIRRGVLLLIVGTSLAALVPLAVKYVHIYHGTSIGLVAMDVARVGFSFFLGVVLARTRGRWEPLVPRLPFWLILAATALLLFAPMGGRGVLRTAYDLAFVTAASPLLIMLGSVATVPDRWRPLSTVLAETSYPLYAIHYPALDWTILLCEAHGWPLPVVSLIVAAALIPLSYLAWRFYDAPVRRWLTAR
jgi:peptidoglycan/LPS O-acetylase OafA/YrhL